MNSRTLDELKIQNFIVHLWDEEKSKNTVEKYERDIKTFIQYLGGMHVSKECVIAYKESLMKKGYAVSSVNSMLASLNSLFAFLEWTDCRVKFVKVQRKIYRPEEKELTKAEYIQLLNAAQKQGNDRLHLIIQTICGTGIRVSELEYITVEAVRRGEACVSLKGKTRMVFIVRELRKRLLQYAAKEHITNGPIFITRSGKSMDRANIWKEMKALCKSANVNPSKVFPHNLRHLFARTFYAIKKDIAKLADILGHSSIDTTRIYTISTGNEHRKQMEFMRLII